MKFILTGAVSTVLGHTVTASSGGVVHRIWSPVHAYGQLVLASSVYACVHLAGDQ